MGRALAILLFLAAAAAADPSYDSALRKITLIEEDRAAPGSRIWLSLQELNAYARVAVSEVAPQGLRQPRLKLGQGTATGSALVDFLKLRELKGPPPNALVAWLLSGEKPVEATARIQTGHGLATVYVQKVKVGAITVQGAALDFLLEHFLLPFYPEAKIGQPFELGHHMDRFEISPAGVTVVIAGKPGTR